VTTTTNSSAAMLMSHRHNEAQIFERNSLGNLTSAMTS